MSQTNSSRMYQREDIVNGTCGDGDTNRMCVFFFGGGWGVDSNGWCEPAIFCWLTKIVRKNGKTVGILRCDVVEVYSSCGRKGGILANYLCLFSDQFQFHMHMSTCFRQVLFKNFGQGRNPSKYYTLKWGNSCLAPPAKLEIPEIQG